MNKQKVNDPVFIDGQAWSVRLPSGGIKEGVPNEWDTIMEKLNKSNDLLHYEDMYSLCQESLNQNGFALNCTIRGFNSANYFGRTFSDGAGKAVGFRPVLTPLDPETLQPAPNRLANLPDGKVVSLGTLYMDDTPLVNPKNPVHLGDIPSYTKGSSIKIGLTNQAPEMQIKWVKAGDVLIASCNLLCNISWNDLDKQGYVFGNQKEKEREAAFELFEDLKFMKKQTGYALAENMQLISNRLKCDEPGGVQLSNDELFTLASKLDRISYISTEPFLDAERLDAVCTMLEKGLDPDRNPDFPKLSAEQTKKLLLSVDNEVFTTLVDSVAGDNRVFYAPDHGAIIPQEEEVEAACKAIQAIKEKKRPLTAMISDAKKQSSPMQGSVSQEFVK